MYSYLTYCITLWGSIFRVNTDKMVKLQKRAIRVIAGVGRQEHTAPLFDSFNILTFREIYIYTVQLLVFKYHHDQLPEILMDFSNIIMIFIITKRDRVIGFMSPRARRPKVLELSGIRVLL